MAVNPIPDLPRPPTIRRIVRNDCEEAIELRRLTMEVEVLRRRDELIAELYRWTSPRNHATHVGLFAEYGGRAVASIGWSHQPGAVDVAWVDVLPLWRRRGLGRLLIERAVDSAIKNRRTFVLADVFETERIAFDLAACEFLKACGFVAGRPRPGSRRYRFTRKIQPPPEPQVGVVRRLIARTGYQTERSDP